ncbi:MAG: hypothetical protein ACYTGV_11155 [Planctomycetota bacterium]|jgi:hypothetical protein
MPGSIDSRNLEALVRGSAGRLARGCLLSSDGNPTEIGGLILDPAYRLENPWNSAARLLVATRCGA